MNLPTAASLAVVTVLASPPASATSISAELWARWPRERPIETPDYSEYQAVLVRWTELPVPQGVSCARQARLIRGAMRAWLVAHRLTGQFTVVIECVP